MNLYGAFDDGLGRFYAVPSALGIVLSTGNTGKYLDQPLTSDSLYLSRDAGVTWTDIASGDYTYEIGENGGILTFVQRQSTNEFKYTLNEGASLQTCSAIATSAFVPDNIQIDLSFNSEYFVMYGSRGTSGVLVQLDFSRVFTRNCTGANTPGADNSDYEEWSPVDPTSRTTCFMGTRRVYVRRKQNAECFNPLQDRLESQALPCACTKDDFECDYCFEWDENSASCMNVCPGYDPTREPINCTDTYQVSLGFRKIPGNGCTGSVVGVSACVLVLVLVLVC